MANEENKNVWDRFLTHRRALPATLGLEEVAKNPSARALAVSVAARAVLAIEERHHFLAVCCRERPGLWATVDGTLTDTPPRVVLAGMLASKRIGEIVADPLGLNFAATAVEKTGGDVVARLKEHCEAVERTLTERWDAVMRIVGAVLVSPMGVLDGENAHALAK